VRPDLGSYTEAASSGMTARRLSAGNNVSLLTNNPVATAANAHRRRN